MSNLGSDSYLSRSSLYQLIAAQLHHDGHIDAANAVVRSTMCSMQPIQGNPERLASLVTMGLYAERMGCSGSYLNHHEIRQLPVLEDHLGQEEEVVEQAEAAKKILMDAVDENHRDGHPHLATRLRGDLLAPVVTGGPPRDDRWFRFVEKSSLTMKNVVRAVSWSSDGQWALCATADGAVRVLSVPAMHSYHYAFAHAHTSAAVKGTSISTKNGGSKLDSTNDARFSGSNTHQLNETALHAVVRYIPPQEASKEILTGIFHPQEELIILGTQLGSVLAYRYTANETFAGSVNRSSEAFSLQDAFPIRSLRVHPSSQYLVYTTDHPAIRMYHIATQRLLTNEAKDDVGWQGSTVSHGELKLQEAVPPSPMHTGAVWDLDFTCDGRIMVTGSADGDIRLWDGRSLRTYETRTKAHCGADVTSVQFSHTGNYVLSSGMDGRAILWDLRKAQTAVRIYGSVQKRKHRTRATFTYREDLILTTCSGPDAEENTVQVYDVFTQMLLSQAVHSSRIRDLRASPVEQSYLTGSEDCGIRLWSPTL